MEFNIQSMKMRSKALIQATKPNPMVVTLVFMIFGYAVWTVLCLAVGYETWLWIVMYILLSVLKIFVDIGYSWYTLGIAREENPDISEMFKPLTLFAIKSVIAVIIKYILMSVGFLLLYVPLLLPFYWFRPLYFIAKDNPEMSIIKMLSTSIKLMKGNKIAWFKLDLSFIGWIILNIITCGITNIYALPLMSTTYAEYYDFLKGKQSIMSAE